MTLHDVIQTAHSQRATDVHLEASLPISMRVNGELRRLPKALGREALQAIAGDLLGNDEWNDFLDRGSYDLTKVVAGVPCRINVMRGDRGVGFAIRLLSTATNTLRSCNLHPQLAEFVKQDYGLILLTGPTGSGKSTTLSAMLEEINQQSNRHIITLESPIEYRLQPKKAFIRQREVGTHTPSYEQGLIDCLREDPDIIVVGEMRDTETMRWTLNAAETGHLVIATMHASNSADAVYRMMMSFAPERQSSVLAQLGDALVAIISQRMSYREELELLVPKLEILVGTHATKNAIRKGEVSKLISLLQTGGAEGCWTFDRYQNWLNDKSDWVYPDPLSSPPSTVERDEAAVSYEPAVESLLEQPPPRRPRVAPQGAPLRAEPERPLVRKPVLQPRRSLAGPSQAGAKSTRSKSGRAVTRVHKDGRIEIPDMDLDLNELASTINVRGEAEDFGSDPGDD